MHLTEKRHLQRPCFLNAVAPSRMRSPSGKSGAAEAACVVYWPSSVAGSRGVLGVRSNSCVIAGMKASHHQSARHGTLLHLPAEQGLNLTSPSDQDAGRSHWSPSVTTACCTEYMKSRPYSGYGRPTRVPLEMKQKGAMVWILEQKGTSGE